MVGAQCNRRAPLAAALAGSVVALGCALPAAAAAAAPREGSCQWISDTFKTDAASLNYGTITPEYKKAWLVQACRTSPTAPKPLDAPAAAGDAAWGPYITLGLVDKTQVPFPRPSRTALPAIDVVSLTTKDDFHVLLDEYGFASWLRHFRDSVRSYTFIGRRQDMPELRLHMRNFSRTFGRHELPPVHFIDEEFFKAGSLKSYRGPYSKVFQQMMKLHVFDLTYLLDDVLIMDSDTSWARDHRFLLANRTAIYVNKLQDRLCTGMDPTAYVSSLLAGPSGAAKMAHDIKEGGGVLKPGTTRERCTYNWCTGGTGPVLEGFDPTKTGGMPRHIMHHMLFQRDVMDDLHETVSKLWGKETFAAAMQACFMAPKSGRCTGRVAEYELYYTWAKCAYPERVRDFTLFDSKFGGPSIVEDEFKGAAGECSEEEMQICRSSGRVLFKGCHDHRKGQLKMGKCVQDRDADSTRNSSASWKLALQ